MTPSLLALMAPAPDGSSPGLTMLLLQIGAIGLVFFFRILRPQQQARKEHGELLKNLKKGDEVVTVGGLMGKVKYIKEDRVTIESGTAAVVVDSARIVKVGDQAAQGSRGMSLLDLHLLGSPVLREASKPIPVVDDAVRRFIADLWETMYSAKGVGLAANQVGVAIRVAVVDAEDQRQVLLNPRIVEACWPPRRSAWGAPPRSPRSGAAR